MTTQEKNFIRDWEIQKEGPKWKYYLQYIIAWSTVVFLSLFFLLKLVMSDRTMGGWKSFYIVAPVAFVLAMMITHLVYTTNEKKLQKILQKKERLN
jgi:hypothetical protein